MEALKTAKPTFIPNKTAKPQTRTALPPKGPPKPPTSRDFSASPGGPKKDGGKRDNRRPAPEQRGPSYRELQEKVRDLERRTDPLQSTQEIKYLRKQIDIQKVRIEEFAINISGLIGALKAIGVPEAAIKKVQARERSPLDLSDLFASGDTIPVLNIMNLLDLFQPEATE